MEKGIDRQESLSIIMNMIEQAKGDFKKGSGKYSLLWGYVVALASGFHFFVFTVPGLAAFNPYVWPVAVFIGLTMTAIFIIRGRGNTRVKTYVGYMQHRIWIAFGIGAGLIYILLWNGPGQLIYPGISLVYTLMLFLSASAFKLKWMYIPVVACVCCMILYKVLPLEYQPLVMALLMICGNIVPGHILNAKGRKNV